MNRMNMGRGVKWVAPETRTLDGQCLIETAYFKKIVTLPMRPTEEVCIRISANNRYCLYVNGKPIHNGPCKGDEWHQYCDCIDIAPHLLAGENVIAVKVVAFHSRGNCNEAGTNVGPMSIVADSYGPMLIVEGQIPGEGIMLSTGLTPWCCMADEATTWHPARAAWWAGNTEIVQGDKLPHGWHSDPSIGKGFSQAIEKWDNETPFGEIDALPLYERPIPFLLMEEVAPMRTMPGTGCLAFEDAEDGIRAVCAPNQTYTVILEADRLTTSYVHLRCIGGTGSRIEMGYSEGFVRRDADGNIVKGDRRDVSGEFFGVSDVYYPSGRDEAYSPFWFRTLRFMHLTVETGEMPLTVYLPRLVETRYPLENGASSASSSDEWIAPIWDISLRTLQLCMHETYEDCPFYEQLQYTMDTRLQMLFTYTLGGDTRMARRTIHDFHTSMLPEGIAQSRFPTNFRQVIPGFSLHWVLMLSDYYKQTGDVELVKDYRFTMERIFRWFHKKKGALGLVERLGYWDFADWTDEWEAGVPNAVAHGPSTVHNLLYAYVLQQSVPLFCAMGMHDLGAMYENEAHEILQTVRDYCWDNERQMLREGPHVSEYSQHAQLWAVLCGLFEGTPGRALMAKVMEDTSLVQCSFVMQFYLFRALEKVGLYEQTEALWSLWRDLLPLNLTTVPEIPGEKTRSDCHAWGALMLYEFPAKILGITQTAPGMSPIEIRPLARFIRDASGQVPTALGTVTVRRTFTADTFSLYVETPAPTRIVLPNGEVFSVDAGTYQYTCAIG